MSNQGAALQLYNNELVKCKYLYSTLYFKTTTTNTIKQAQNFYSV